MTFWWPFTSSRRVQEVHQETTLSTCGSFMTSWPDQWRWFEVGHKRSRASPPCPNTTKTSSSTRLSWSSLFYGYHTGNTKGLFFFASKFGLCTPDLKSVFSILARSCGLKFVVSVHLQIQPRGREADLLRRLSVAPASVPARLWGVDWQHRWILC